VPNRWRFPIIGSGEGPGGFLWFMVLCFGCKKKSLNKKYVKVKRRKTSIVIDVEDMSVSIMKCFVW
jgi:hypothetical protein